LFVRNTAKDHKARIACREPLKVSQDRGLVIFPTEIQNTCRWIQIGPALAQFLLTRGPRQAHAPPSDLLQPNNTISLSRFLPKPRSIHPVTGLIVDYSSSGVRPCADLDAVSPSENIFWGHFQPGIQSCLNRAYSAVRDAVSRMGWDRFREVACSDGRRDVDSAPLAIRVEPMSVTTSTAGRVIAKSL
jgi:hypothetical protein